MGALPVYRGKQVHSYRMSGLSIRSEIELPGLIPTDGEGEPDVEPVIFDMAVHFERARERRRQVSEDLEVRRLQSGANQVNRFR